MNITDVRDVLGASVTLVGALCDHANVNKFSKYKPVEFNTRIGLTESDFSSVNFGLDIEEMTDVKNSQGKLWKYNRPSAYARRIGDFKNYYHSAPIALLQIQGTSKSINRFDGSGKSIAFSILPAPSGAELLCLNVSNLTPNGGDGVLLNNYYLAAAIYQGSTLKGTYYSFSTIKYSSGTGADMNGASIVLSSGAYFNSSDAPIENYASGSYTIYLYITNYDTDIPIGVVRKFWPVNYTASNPQAINATVLALSDVFSVQTLGILPYSGGVWADSSTNYLTGIISQAVRGTYYRFWLKIRFNNLTGSTVYLDKSNVFVFYNKITTWGGTVSRASQALGSGTMSIAANSYVDAIVEYITPLPNTIVNSTGSLTLNVHVHLGNSDSGEQFYENLPPAITLQYND